MQTYFYRVGADGPRFDTHHEADAWAASGNVGSAYEIVCCAYCDTCNDEVPAGEPDRGCPFCGGRWTPMGDGEWYAFTGGDKVAFQAAQATKVAYKQRHQRELARLAAWNSGHPLRRETAVPPVNEPCP